MSRACAGCGTEISMQKDHIGYPRYERTPEGRLIVDWYHPECDPERSPTSSWYHPECDAERPAQGTLGL